MGRKKDDEKSACGYAEKIIVGRAGTVSIKSDVMIVPHHGADNASSLCFIKAVDPAFVIFSSGHQYNHPRAEVANRYISHGVSLKEMFRTDRGDDEEGDKEWKHEYIKDCQDSAGDDDVEIILHSNGEQRVFYLNSENDC